VFTLGTCFAIIKAIVLAGKGRLRQIWRIVFKRGDCRFASNIKDMLAYLQTLRANPTNPETDISVFREILAFRVRHMIIKKLSKRLTIDKLQSFSPNFKQMIQELASSKLIAFVRLDLHCYSSEVKADTVVLEQLLSFAHSATDQTSLY
jgi:hypothetical protein